MSTTTPRIHLVKPAPTDNVDVVANLGGNFDIIDTAIAALQDNDPSATLKMTLAAAAPAGWLLCDGSLINRVTYAALFAVIGTTYGAGDGVTTFGLPNLKGRVPVGLDAAQAEFNVLGKTGGEKTHLLIASELPNHTHANLFSSGFATGTPDPVSSIAAGAASGRWSASFPSASGGGAAVHNNLQPYLTVNYIIKT